jgi:hypothetical protein
MAKHKHIPFVVLGAHDKPNKGMTEIEYVMWFIDLFFANKIWHDRDFTQL